MAMDNIADRWDSQEVEEQILHLIEIHN
jgi:hypothetical protein